MKSNESNITKSIRLHGATSDVVFLLKAFVSIKHIEFNKVLHCNKTLVK